MKTQHLLYLHGFLSDENSVKGQFVKQRLAEDMPNVQVHCITYPISLPDISVGYIKNYIEYQMLADQSGETPIDWAVMGSSMGGYYAQYIARQYGVPYIMINPALDPVTTLSEHMGEYQHPRTREQININEQYLAQLATYEITPEAWEEALLLIDRGDEVLDPNYAMALYQDRCKCLIYEQGDHAFQHLEEAWPHILAFLKR